MKCPKCKSKYNRYNICTNNDCILSTIPYKESNWIGWESLFYRLIGFHYNPIWLYRKLKNLLFNRYDLIRTKLPKHCWIDKDHIMLYGMMNLLVEYVEMEDPFKYLVTDESDVDFLNEFNKEQINNYQRLLELYIDWRVVYPKILKRCNDLLYNKSIKFEEIDVINYIDKFKDVDYSVYNEVDEMKFKFEQDMLHRLIDLRELMWV